MWGKEQLSSFCPRSQVVYSSGWFGIPFVLACVEPLEQLACEELKSSGMVPGASLRISKQCDVNVAKLHPTQRPYFASLRLIYCVSSYLSSLLRIAIVPIFCRLMKCNVPRGQKQSLYCIRTADSRNQQKGAAMAGTCGF